MCSVSEAQRMGVHNPVAYSFQRCLSKAQAMPLVGIVVSPLKIVAGVVMAVAGAIFGLGSLVFGSTHYANKFGELALLGVGSTVYGVLNITSLTVVGIACEFFTNCAGLFFNFVFSKY